MPKPIRPHRLSRRWLAGIVVLATSVLPGCLTQALWQDELFRPSMPELVLDVVAEQTVVHDGQLEVLRLHPDAEPQLRFCDRVDGGTMQLRADPRDGEPAGVAAMGWLLASDCGDVTGARLLVEQHHYLGEGISEAAELELELRPRAGRLGEMVAAAAVPERVLDQLGASGRLRFAFEPAEVEARTLAEQCRLRLAAVDLAAMLGSAGPVTVEQVVFCDEQGRPGEPRRSSVATDIWSEAGEWVAVLSEEEQLERDLAMLTGQTMWVAVHCEAQRRYLRFAAGELWLVFAGERRGDRIVHHSRWRRATSSPDGQGQLLAVLPGTLERHELTAWRGEPWAWGRVPSDGLAVWQKVLLTPFTLAIDIVFQEAWRFFLPWRQYDSDHGVGRGR